MEPIEIIVIISCILIVGGVLANYIYKKIRKLPTGQCASCKKTLTGSALVKAYRKKYKKEKVS